ncbi:MAG: hypothetical protein HFI17_14590 [Lachnospiraceae bacterium]|nr:hypothetical protein [Lachnospiraceae bacterium]
MPEPCAEADADLRKGGRGREPPTDTDGLPAVTPEVRLEYLREQIYCLQSR